jgi:hypothetical protein
MQPSEGQSLSKGEEDHEIGCVIILICLYCNARKHLSKEERDRHQQSSHVVIPKSDGDYFFALFAIVHSPSEHRRRLVRKWCKTDLCNETKVRRRNAHERADRKLTQRKPKCARLSETPPTFSLPLTTRLKVDTQDRKEHDSSIYTLNAMLCRC